MTHRLRASNLKVPFGIYLTGAVRLYLDRDKRRGTRVVKANATSLAHATGVEQDAFLIPNNHSIANGVGIPSKLE